MTARQIEPLRPALVLGALFALLAVMAGAFGAHGLRGVIDERGLEVFQTAVTYQIYHSLALILVAILPVAGLSRRLLGIAAGFFVAGILLFSGSLYLLVLTDLRWMGPVTPVGGIGFMVGWILVLMAGFRR
ncbi:proline--tRNA ligase [Marinobacter salarius]|nr:proline--tRNA ligase [Marinobacter salarius]